jgi:hypothetical protein
MDDELKTVPVFLRTASYLPRVTVKDGRVLEEILAGSTLFDVGAELRGAAAEATYAATDPAILRRLRDTSVPFLVDPQTLRFSGQAFKEIGAFTRLPYTPSEVVDAHNASGLDAPVLAGNVLRFEQAIGSAAYVSAAFPLHDRHAKTWAELNRRLLTASCDANGSGDIEQRPLLAQIAPGPAALFEPEAVIEPMLDLPVAGAYVEPLVLNSARDSVEKLFRYLRFLEVFEEAGLPVVASRVGAFGPVLSALGITAFTSGLGEAEASNLAALNRKRTQKEQPSDGPRGSRRIYLGPLKTTMARRQAELILSRDGLRGKFSCSLGCCRFAELSDLAGRSRHHYLWSRNDEVRAIREQPTRSAKLDLVHEELRNARELSRLVRRTLFKQQTELPSFDHVDRWLRALAREDEARAAA